MDLLELGAEPVLNWDEFKFTEAITDTDEDWSVSESSSCSGAEFALEDIVPESKVQAALDQLDLLASNTTSALSIPQSFGAASSGILEDRNFMKRGLKRMSSQWSVLSMSDDLDLNGRTEAILDFDEMLEPALVAPQQVCEPVVEHKRRPRTEEGPATAPAKKLKPANLEVCARISAGLLEPSVALKLERVDSVSTDDTALASSPRSASSSSSSRVSTPVKRTSGAGGKGPKRCEFCLEKFDSSDELQAHRQQHFVGSQHFKCTFPGCTKDYATGEGLRLHVRNVHLGAKNWKCLAAGCSRSFVRQSDLRMHIIRMHSDIRPYPCLVQTCNKSFACHSELRRHVLSCHKLPCPKPEKIETPQAKSNNVDPTFIQGLMLKKQE